MSEAEWADENPAPSKKLVPTWLWFCGGGCLLAVVLAVVAVMIGVSWFEDGRDPDIQYARLEEQIEMDARPEEWVLQFGTSFPMDMWIFEDTRGYAIVFMHFDSSEASEARGELFDPDVSTGFNGMGERGDATVQSINVQGRDIEMMTYYQRGTGQQGSNTGQTGMLDLTPEGAAGLTLMMITRVSGEDTITAEEANTILEPFHIGPDR